VGCENAAVHKTNPHTEAGHDASAKAHDLSACGGYKWSAMESGPRQEYGGLICDLTDIRGGVRSLIAENLFKSDDLDQPTKPVGDGRAN
jgi:hypothetical protein